MDEKRIQRKLEHLKIAGQYRVTASDSWLGDIALIPNSVPELDLDDVDLTIEIAGKTLKAPLLIEAMTGGHPETRDINRRLALLARDCGLGMAVGSQQAAINDHELKDTYKVARDVNPEGLILANVSAMSPPETVARAVEMIGADGVQVHFNLAQELTMAEGDRCFRRLKENLLDIQAASKVPVIAKGVGFGFSREDALFFKKCGVSMVDVGGKGGTNFIKIENQRGDICYSGLEEWGIPTAVSLLECLSVPGLAVIASGGVRSALDIGRCLALGARAAGMALPFLKLVGLSDEEMVKATGRLLYELKCVFLLCGAKDISEMSAKPVIITGRTREWLMERGLTLEDIRGSRL